MAQDKPTRSTRRNTRTSPTRGAGGRDSASMLLLGIVLGLIAAFSAMFMYHRSQQHPQQAGKSAEQPLTPASVQPRTPTSHTTPQAAIVGPGTPPFGISEDVFEAGAHLYRSRCATCHGTPRRVVTAAHPTALQLWQPNQAGATGVGRQHPAQIYQSIAEGAPNSGMPAYRGVLTSTQLWQLSLLLSNAGQDLPDPVLRLLDAPKP